MYLTVYLIQTNFSNHFFCSIHLAFPIDAIRQIDYRENDLSCDLVESLNIGCVSLDITKKLYVLSPWIWLLVTEVGGTRERTFSSQETK